MEFIVFPVIGIINTAKAIYNNGIFTEPNNGKTRFESYVPSKSIGAAQNASAIGLNQPPMTFRSSTRPTKNAAKVVRAKARISEIGKNKYKTINDDSKPTIIDMPPGLATIVFSFLLASRTVIFRFSKNRITNGVKK